MNAVLSTSPGSAGTSERDHLTFPAHQTEPESRRPLVDVSAELLRTIAEVLDIRAVFPRVSEIVKPVLSHDALELVLCDQNGHVRREARSTEYLPGHRGCALKGDEAFHIVRDLRRPRPRLVGWDKDVDDDLIVAGYRSVLNVRSITRHQVMHLGFFSKQPDAYDPDDVSTAQQIAHYVAVAVAHEQLAAAERERADGRGRTERLDARVRTLADKSGAMSGRSRMIGRSDAWQRVLAKALRVAPTDTTVFLQGESGTGKEVVARFIHEASPRADGPFVAINCAALPEHLLESELFGYERGAFTGAQQAKAGQIELAARGVLFLDEVSEMSPSAQAKFLRFLQEREFQRLGGTRTQKANVRVIAASNRDLRQAVEQGTFREDLFYRLQVFDIVLPPLRQRITDVPLLAAQFLEELSQAMGRPPARVTDEAREALLAYRWPGNVRELRNVLERAAILSDDGVIRRGDLSLQLSTAAGAVPNDLAGMERQTIQNVLRQTEWNKSKAAKELGLTRSQLYVRLRKYGVENAETP
jgi:transcriptional regulator with PAS, ATPase and Fis domain